VGSARIASHPGTSCYTGEVTGGGSLWHGSARLSKLGLATKGRDASPLVARQGIEAREWVQG